MTDKKTTLATFSRRFPVIGKIMKLKKIALLRFLALGMALSAVAIPQFLMASDHDDGEVDTKGRNQNLTDLYVFRERDQRASAAAGDLIFIMNTNPRSLPRQQYYFSNNSLYEFKVTRVTDKNATPTGRPDVILRFEFSAPDSTGKQQIKLTTIADGQATTVSNLNTTPIRATAPTINQATVGSSNLTVFAGLREDPFFFDVEQFFKVRAGAAGFGPVVGFRPPNAAIDFTKDYNVNAIAVRVPIRFLQGSTSVTTFDVWETISSRLQKGFKQVERLARPAINEGLVITNDFLNALNSVGPDFEAAALAGQQPQAQIAGPIVNEAKNTLKALGNSDAEANALIAAFLPDVMRIDTTQPSNYDVTIPATCLNTKKSPICGRKLKDDTIDLTLRVISKGAVTGDNVSYEGTPGNPAQGHDPLVPDFPYLAPAN